MNRRPPPPMLPVLAAIAASIAAVADGGAAQTASSHRGGNALGAAIAEARGSPGKVSRRADSDDPPSFLGVFVPTLAITYLADWVGFASLIGAGYGRSAGLAAVAITVPVVAPALMAGAMSRRFKPALAGSALGAALSAAIWRSFDPDNMWNLVLPAFHTLLTVAVARLGGGAG